MNINLLILEHGNLFTSLLSSRLDKLNCRILQTSGQNGLSDLIARNGINVVLVNLLDLKAEGIELLKTIKKTNLQAEVITINNPEQIGLSMKAMKLGVFDELFPPCDVEHLAARIRDAGEKSRKEKKKKNHCSDATRNIWRRPHSPKPASMPRQET